MNNNNANYITDVDVTMSQSTVCYSTDYDTINLNTVFTI